MYNVEHNGYVIRLNSNPNACWSVTAGSFTEDEKLISVFTFASEAFWVWKNQYQKDIAYVCAM